MWRERGAVERLLTRLAGPHSSLPTRQILEREGTEKLRAGAGVEAGEVEARCGVAERVDGRAPSVGGVDHFSMREFELFEVLYVLLLSSLLLLVLLMLVCCCCHRRCPCCWHCCW